MKVQERSIGELLDLLITASIRCWFAQDEICKEENDDATVARYAKIAQQSNNKRNLLIRAIDERMGDIQNSPSEKTYGDKNSK
jgi:hypothetical protein